MTPDFVVRYSTEAIQIALLISAPILGFGLVTGLVISIFQAVTQINEMTLTIVPKILAAIVAMILFGPWMLQILLDFTRELFVNIPFYIR